MHNTIIYKSIRIVFISILIHFSLHTYAQDRIVFYNVENYFDTYNQIGKSDEAYLPNSLKRWNYSKFKSKTQNIQKVLTSISPKQLPLLIGLAEIENITVVHELLNTKGISKSNYNIIHKESPDPRGIDVCLLYNKKRIHLIKKEFIKVCISKRKSRYTREILYAKLIRNNTDTLNVYVNHWSSECGGKRKTERKRIIAAKNLVKHINKLISKDKNAKIIIMGDFNESPQDIALRKYIYHHPYLRNIIPDKKKESRGTLKFKNKWQIFDQIIVSKNISKLSMHIYNNKFLLETDKKYGGFKPKRTFLGMKFQNGYSDHLPVYIDLPIH